MSQQINLYQPIFRKERIVFSAGTIAALTAGFVVLLLLWSVLVHQRVAGLEAEHERQLRSEERAVDQLSRLQQQARSEAPDPSLQARVDRLRARRDSLELSLDALARQAPVTGSGLAERLGALARPLPDGMWLSRVELGSAEPSVTIEGRALAPRLVPDYLQLLGGEAQFAGTAFRTLRLDALESGQAGVRFIVSTREETP